MLTLKDCIDLCGLTKEEIDAIAEHEHLPEIIAVELAAYMVQTPEGVPAIKRMSVDDIAAAEARGNRAHARRLPAALCHFARTHPEYAKVSSGSGG
ncbi:MAG: hypothetical protein EXQ96_02425 [Alphaproteobacteria bacterium]|nr:hypothetical protein [Alphaproteobacteria bacterium]